MGNQRQTALVTGASSGIGMEFAKLLAENNFNLVLVARSRDKLEELKLKICEKNNVDITILCEDLEDISAPKRLHDTLNQAGTNIDVLINNAGFGLEGEFTQMDIDRQQGMINLNVSGMTQMAYFFAKDMAKRGYGRILNTGSISSFMPTPLMTVYSATKAYILSFSRSLNNECRLYGDVSVTALCPGPVRTNFSNIAGVRKWMKFFNGFYASPEYIAKVGYKALFRKRNVKPAGKGIPLLVSLGKFAPMSWIDGIMWMLAKPKK